MTKDKLKKEAEEYANTHGTTVMGFEENLDCTDFVIEAYLAGAEPRETRIVGLEAENEWIRTKYYELQDTLKKVRLALIKERTANIMNYGKGGVEMFDDCFEILKGVSN